MTTATLQQDTLFNLTDGNSYGLIDIIREIYDLPTNMVRLLKHYAYREKYKGIICESQKSIAKEIGVTDRTVRTLNKKLVKIDLLKVDSPALHRRSSHKEHNKYFLNHERFKPYIDRLKSKKPAKPDDNNFSSGISSGISSGHYNKDKRFKDYTNTSEILKEIQTNFGASDSIMEQAVKIAENNQRVKNGSVKFTRFLKGVLKNIVPGYKEKLILQENSIKAAQERIKNLQQFEKETNTKTQKPVKDFSVLIKKPQVVRGRMTQEELRVQAEMLIAQGL